jgi:hypothetical protein
VVTRLFVEDTAWHCFFQESGTAEEKALLRFTSLTDNRRLCAGHWLHTADFPWPSLVGSWVIGHHQASSGKGAQSRSGFGSSGLVHVENIEVLLNKLQRLSVLWVYCSLESVSYQTSEL